MSSSRTVSRAIIPAVVAASLMVAPLLAAADVSPAVVGDLTAASASGGQDLLAALTRAVTADPANAAGIAAQARALRPDLAARIDAATAAGEIEIAPAAGPVIGLALGPLLAGGGAAAGVAALAGAGGGGGDGDAPPGPGPASSIAASTMVRSQPGHVRDAPVDGLAMIRLRHEF